MSGDQDLGKLPKLSGAKDFIPWRRRMKAFIQRSDVGLVGLSNLSETSTTNQRTAWRKAMIRTKSAIVLTLDSGPMAQTSDIIDDEDKSAKDLWDALSTLYTASNEQTVINLMQELENLEYKEDGNWESHLNKFHEILGKLASLGKTIPDSGKVSKLIRTLADHFSPLAIVSMHMSYKELVNAVETEISRCRMKKAEKSKGGVNVPKINSAGVKGLKVKDGRIDKLNNEDNVCWICGLNNHRSRDCWHRADKLARRGMEPYHGQCHGRGRGFRGRGRGTRFFRGRGRGGYQYGYQQLPQMQQNVSPHSQQQGNCFDRNTHNQFLVENNSPSGQAARIPDQAAPYPGNSSNVHQNQNRPYGFMTRIKFRSTIAKCAEDKTPDALIDSGGSHHFFHSKRSFAQYELIDTAQVQAASELSVIVGKGTVFIPLDGGFYTALPSEYFICRSLDHEIQHIVYYGLTCSF